MSLDELLGLEALPRKKGDAALVRKIQKAWRELPYRVKLAPLRDFDKFPDAPPGIIDPERVKRAAVASVTRYSNWVESIFSKTPPKHQLAVATAAMVMWPLDRGGVPDVEEFLTEAHLNRLAEVEADFPYPCLTQEPVPGSGPGDVDGRDARARIVMGVTPKWISRNLLTKKEAHRWLSCQPDGVWVQEPSFWYFTRELGIPADELPRGIDYSAAGSSREGLEWFTSVWRDPQRRAALLRERVQLGPGGAEIRGRFYDRLHELQREDLVRSVERSFQNAINRAVRETVENYEPDQVLVEKPGWWFDTPYAELLVTPRQLVNEGTEMQHCAGMYPPLVERGESLVISIRTDTCRSTVELDPVDHDVRQHVGIGNTDPHPDCEAVLRELHKRWTFG